MYGRLSLISQTTHVRRARYAVPCFLGVKKIYKLRLHMNTKVLANQQKTNISLVPADTGCYLENLSKTRQKKYSYSFNHFG